MSLSANLTGANQFELVYSRQLRGNPANWKGRPRIPNIEPLEIPVLFSSRVFIVSAVNIHKTYLKAGYLYYEIEGIRIDDRVTFETVAASPFTAADAAKRLVLLNNVELVVFPRFSEQLRLRFEPVPWIDALTFALWEYRGVEADSTEELIQALRAQIASLEYRLEQLLP
jgi:hypothetical protein